MNEREYLHMYSEEESHWWYSGMRSIVLALLPPASVQAQGLLLDAGCGTGYNLLWLRDRYGARAVGLDLYALALTLSRARGQPHLVRGDTCSLPFQSGQFDLVTALDVVSHVKGAEARVLALREFHRVLKRGGTILVRVAAFEWLRSSHDDEILTRHRYSRRELRSAMERAGFELKRLTYANSLLFPAAAAWRFLKKARLAPAGSDVRAATRGPKWINSGLRRILELEASFLRKPGSTLPVGLSLIAVARKP